jgi:hypothetical protein
MTSLEMNILQMDDEGYTVAQICETLAVPPAMVWEVLMAEIVEGAVEAGGYEEAIEEQDPFRDDVEADADALASVGWGTDEDYGFFNEEF